MEGLWNGKVNKAQNRNKIRISDIINPLNSIWYRKILFSFFIFHDSKKFPLCYIFVTVHLQSWISCRHNQLARFDAANPIFRASFQRLIVPRWIPPNDTSQCPPLHYYYKTFSSPPARMYANYIVINESAKLWSLNCVKIYCSQSVRLILGY